MDDAFLERLTPILDDEDRERAFFDLCALYRQATGVQREAIRSRWDFGRAWRIPADSTLLCALPGARPPVERLQAVLLYHSIEGGAIDWRDTLVALCVIYHSALRLGLDAGALFEEVAALSAPTTARLLREFLARPPELRSLAAFGWEEVTTPHGVAFRWPIH